MHTDDTDDYERCQGHDCRRWVAYSDLADGLCEYCQEEPAASDMFRAYGHEYVEECGATWPHGTAKDPHEVCDYPKGSPARREWVAGFLEAA